MSKQFSDTRYLRERQYRDASNLERRVSLHERFSTNPLGWHPWVFSQFDFSPSARILEVGCGPGYLWVHTRSRIKPRWDVTISDVSEGMLAEARDRVGHLPNLSVACLDAQYLPFASDQFDAVIANHMLYHMPEVHQAIAALHRVLKPGGTLYATTNGEEHLLEMARLVRLADSEGGSNPESILQSGVRNFSLQSGGAKLERYFEEVWIRRYPDSLRVTEPEAIVQFIKSSSIFRLTDGGLEKLLELLNEEIKANGAVTIRKDPGMFIAWKANGR